MSDLVKIHTEPAIFITNYFGVFKNVLFKLFLINAIQPFEILNTDIFYYNLESYINHSFLIKYLDLGNFMKFHGSVNDYLLIC